MMALSGISLDCIPRESRHWAESRIKNLNKKKMNYECLLIVHFNLVNSKIHILKILVTI